MAQHDRPLNGLRVLVTRPEPQAEHLAAMIKAAGGHPVIIPTIAIVPVARDLWALDNLVDADMLIFVSRNAVTHFIAAQPEGVMESVLLGSVGRGTTETLQQYGLPVHYQPREGSGSEALLALPELAEMKGKKIVIVRGKGGREYLADTLRQRGAQVHYLEVYERILPSLNDLQIEQAKAVDCLICTSVESVRNLCILLHSHLESMMNKPLLVCSDRIRKQAQELGFATLSVSDEASDEALVKQLIEMETKQWKQK